MFEALSFNAISSSIKGLLEMVSKERLTNGNSIWIYQIAKNERLNRIFKFGPLLTPRLIFGQKF